MSLQVVHRIESSSMYNELADAHCHLDMFADPATVISDARTGGVGIMVTSGGSRASSMAAMRIADSSSVFAVIGVDPASAELDGDFIGEMAGLVKANRCVVGIGEVGLDYNKGGPKEMQKRAFERQVAVAQDLGIPLVIHSRQAIEDVIGIVKEHDVRAAMFHYFEGDEEQAMLLAGMGNLISIPPIESAKRKRVIGALDIGSIAAETDSPAVGKSPLDVIGVVEWIAMTKGMDFVGAAHSVTENVKKLFCL